MVGTDGADSAALYKAIMLCTPNQSDGSKNDGGQKPFNSTVATFQPLGTSGMKARKTSCAKKPSPAQIQHRQYLKNLRNMIQANVAKAKEDDDAEKAKRSSAAKSAEKQRQIVKNMKESLEEGNELSAGALENALSNKPVWALTEAQVQDVEAQQVERHEDDLVNWAQNLDWSKYLNENDDFKRIVSAAKETADEQFYDDLVAEFNEGDDEAVHDYEESEYSSIHSSASAAFRQGQDVCTCDHEEEDDDAASHRALVKKVKQELSRQNPESGLVHSDVSVSAIVNQCKNQLDTAIELPVPDPIKVVHGDIERDEEVQVQNLPYQYRCPAV